jgi:hypothetical protein
MKGATFACWIITAVLWTGCTGKLVKKPEAPPDLISRDTMVNIMADLMLMDAIVFFEQRKGTLKTNEISYYLHNSITEKYRITRNQFEASFNYYQHNLAEFDKMLADVITRLTILNTETGKD